MKRKITFFACGKPVGSLGAAVELAFPSEASRLDSRLSRSASASPPKPAPLRRSMSRRLSAGSKCGTEFMLASLEVVGVVTALSSTADSRFNVPGQVFSIPNIEPGTWNLEQT